MEDFSIDIEKMLECGERPNCVSTVAARKFQKIAPMRYSVTKNQAKTALLWMIRGNPHAKMVKNQGDYVHVVFTTKFFQFKDDVEFIFDDSKKLLHFRSQSRVGYFDFGANKKRMLAIKKILAPAFKAGKQKTGAST